jgi:murein DD-endopeptidase MepM/ murein hydrolase activator NlpD
VRNISIAAIAILIVFIVIRSNFNVTQDRAETPPVQKTCREICGTVERGETLFDIFKRYSLDLKDMLELKEAAADIHRLRHLYPGRGYRITADENNRVDSLDYWIDEDSMLSVRRTETGFLAEKVCVEYEKKILQIGGVINENLIASMGDGRDRLMLALRLSDIFAWDIDFTSDLRNGDTYKIVVEGYELDGEFRKYGDILSAEFANNGKVYNAYRFETGGEAGYYDAEGRSIKRAFLKAPLNYRRISSHFSKSRLHPVLRIYRPHHGLDYAAPAGTPVSAVGNGTVTFSGYKGQYGNLVVIRHPNNWKTYYGHLSRIAKGARSGAKVTQGQVIGFVGATGLATGPHLHYELRINNKPTNPLTVKMPPGKAVPGALIDEFMVFKDQMDMRITSIDTGRYTSIGEKGKKGT